MTHDESTRAIAAAITLLMTIAGGCGSPSAEDVKPIPSSDAGSDASNDAADPGAAASKDAQPAELCALTGPPKSGPGDILVYNDEFDGATLDPLRWTVASGPTGHGTVASHASPNNTLLRAGALHIVSDRSASGEAPYVTGHIDSLGKFARTYGKIEFRARFSKAQGVWSAIWGRPWKTAFPELDIEIVYRRGASEVYFVNHWAEPPLPADERPTFTMMKDVDVTQFHTYSIVWKPGSLVYQIDGVTKLEATPRGVPDAPVYWIINGWVGGWVGAPTAETPFPHTFDVDYVRVYRVDGVIAAPEIRLLTSATTFARGSAVGVAIANFDEACAHVEMYDGDALVRKKSAPPYLFSLSGLAPGRHALAFVATDGVRSTRSTLDAVLE